MNKKQFEYVSMLSKTLNFTRAAEELGISQPSLSQYIKKTETELGAELFIRSGQDIRLTDACSVYLEAGRRIFDIEHRMNADLLDLSEHKTGSIVIGTSPFRSAAMMPETVKRFKERYPDICIVVEEHTTGELYEGLEHGAFDLCLSLYPVNEHLFSYDDITEEELVLAVPSCAPAFPTRTVPDRKYPAIEAHNLNGKPFVTITETQIMQRELDGLVADHALSLKKTAVVKSLEAQIAMVRAGVGMALLPTGIERFCAGGEVTFYSFCEALPKRRVIAMWSKARPLTKTAQKLVECMKEIEW